MAKPINLDEAGDSEDLQALFDTIATGAPPPAPPARVVSRTRYQRPRTREQASYASC